VSTRSFVGPAPGKRQRPAIVVVVVLVVVVVVGTVVVVVATVVLVVATVVVVVAMVVVVVATVVVVVGRVMVVVATVVVVVGTDVVVVATVVVVVGTVVVVVTGTVLVVVDPHGRFAGRGRHTRMTSSESTVGVALRAHAITRSCCFPGRSGPKGPRRAATATGTNAPPQDDFARSSPSASSEYRGVTPLRRARP